MQAIAKARPMPKPRSKPKDKIGGILVLFLFLIGLGILLYPTVSSWFNDQQSVSVVNTYENDVSFIPKEERDYELQKALDYNNSLRGDPVKDPFIPGSGMALPQNYTECLNIGSVMATIEIPQIDVKLPIYHGVSEEVLQKGVGHMEGTALPIGGEGGHTVLTGHTGLPNAHLFTDLDQLVEGDRFYIHVLGKELVYEVDQIKVILPEDVSDLVTWGDKDYITLITCTPYGINSHRLLVRGERVYTMTKDIGLRAKIPMANQLMLILALLILLILIIRIVYKYIKNRQEKKQLCKETWREAMAQQKENRGKTE